MHEYPPDDEIDLLCDQFERDLQDQKKPSIESYLTLIHQARQSQLLYWLLTVQLQYIGNSERQKHQLIEDLRTNFHQFRNVIDDAASGCNVPTKKLPHIPGYSIKRYVKKGGQGTVFHAIQNRTGQDVAIKLVSKSQLTQIAKDHRVRVVAQLEKEIRTAAGLNHPNIVKVFDAGECDAGFFFVMQWVKGGSLADRKTLSQNDAAKVIRSVADALAAAHTSGVLHLDVKPHNILMDETSKQPLLADFGLARLTQEVTSETAIAGTLGYMAPEQARGAPLDARTDVYGLGATFYELLTGKKPYQDVSLPYNETERDAWIPVSPREILIELNPELDRICTTCLHFDAEARYQNCREVAAAIDRYRHTDDGRIIARIGAQTLFASPLLLITNLLVMAQIQVGWTENGMRESLIWITMFSMYAVVFGVFGSVSRFDRHSPEHLAVESLWAVWLAKFFSAIAIAGSLRLCMSAREAILMCYPMFSALTGFALATMAPRYWRVMYGFAIIALASSFVLTWTVVQNYNVAPAIYGSLATSLSCLWGMKLRQLAREQRSPITASELAPTVGIVANTS